MELTLKEKISLFKLPKDLDPENPPLESIWATTDTKEEETDRIQGKYIHSMFNSDLDQEEEEEEEEIDRIVIPAEDKL